MINKFSQFLVEEEKTVYFTFGRMNPPTIGHGKLLDVLASKAGRNPYRVFLSHSQDKNKRKNLHFFTNLQEHIEKFKNIELARISIDRGSRHSNRKLMMCVFERF